jgi:hypothetical protein
MKHNAMISSVLLIVLTFSACEQAQQHSEQDKSNDDKAAVQKKTATDEPDTSKTQQEDSTVSPLISAEELSELTKSKTTGLRVLEPAQDSNDFKEGHIPSARFVDWVDDMTNPDDVASYRNPNATQIGELMSRLGVNNGDRIVIYDRLSSRLSARLY